MALTDKLEEIVWKKVIESVHDLGKILMRPYDHEELTIKGMLDQANCTASWALLLFEKNTIVNDLMPIAHDLLTYLHDLVKDKRYEDGQGLIRATELDKIIKPNIFIRFPEDLIPAFKLILRTYFKTYYLIG